MSMPPEIAASQALYAVHAAGRRMAFNDLLAEDVRWHSAGPAGLPWAGLREGRGAVREYFRILERESAIEDYAAEHAAGDGGWLILPGTTRVRRGRVGNPLTLRRGCS